METVGPGRRRMTGRSWDLLRSHAMCGRVLEEGFVVRIRSEPTERCEECLSPETLFTDGKYVCMACRYEWNPSFPYAVQASRGVCPKCDSRAVKRLKDPKGSGHVLFCESCRWTWKA